MAQAARPGGGPTAAVRALDAARVAYRLHRFDADGVSHDHAAEAARRLGFPPSLVFKTLVAAAGPGLGGLVVAVLPGDERLSLKALARAAGVKCAVMADPALAERATGYVTGGISPIGQRSQLRTFVDTAALSAATILVSGGRRGLDVELSPSDLIALTEAMVSDLTR